ncbi:uncharacterized protein L203_103459 [Cryptococcus depauperatus CBS 7841]|uniref:Transcription factor IIIC 90kDa subunit N-terminal domain-containing protein n=1 Tax=Cryptococcus depauperatus CBS 7841 TaxID=1295531 RepID=A0AAJ8M1N8_9TREE
MAELSLPQPTILTSRTLQSKLCSPTPHGISWNDDGQCMFITPKGIVVTTPYIASTLPPPTYPMDLRQVQKVTKTQRGRYTKDDAEDEGEAQHNPHIASQNRQKARRPEGGEVGWWSTVIEAERAHDRDQMSNHNTTEDRCMASVVLGDKDFSLKQAVWSPSGLSSLGGCLLVALTTSLRISVYAPQDDPLREPWIEIVDLSLLTNELFPESEDKLLRMRPACVQWSSFIPLPSMLNIDGSILAVSYRVGKVILWTYQSKTFEPLGIIDLGSSGVWASDMAWSSWKITDEDCEACLAFGLTDGSIKVLLISRKPENGSWAFKTSHLVAIDEDERSITAIRWIKDVLVWTKTASVHMFASEKSQGVAWKGKRMVRLNRIGNWPSANAMDNCIGIHLLTKSTLVVVLSSLSTHLIESFDRMPALAPDIESLRLALPLRQMYLEHLSANPAMSITRWRKLTVNHDGWTTQASGWTAIGSWGNLMAWVTEPKSYHSLHASADAESYIHFVVANLGSVGPQLDESIIMALKRTIEQPPILLHISSQFVLLPFLLHLLTLSQSELLAAELLKLAQLDTQPTDVSPGDIGLWSHSALNSRRLRLVLTLWCISTFPSFASEFQALAKSISAEIHSYLITLTLQMISESAIATVAIDPTDRIYLHCLIKRAQGPSGPIAAPAYPGAAEVSQSHIKQLSIWISQEGDASSIPQASAEDGCAICGTIVGEDGRCEKGHQLTERCSVTNLIISEIPYRICSICSAPSLLPWRYRNSPLPLGRNGRPQDAASSTQARSSTKVSPSRPRNDDHAAETNRGPIVQMVLEHAVECPICGGRWIRVGKRTSF